MTGGTIGDILEGKAEQVDPIVSEVSIFKQLIKERAGRFDLLRELLSNAGAKEVGAQHIETNYTPPQPKTTSSLRQVMNSCCRFS